MRVKKEFLSVCYPIKAIGTQTRTKKQPDWRTKLVQSHTNTNRGHTHTQCRTYVNCQAIRTNTHTKKNMHTWARRTCTRTHKHICTHIHMHSPHSRATLMTQTHKDIGIAYAAQANEIHANILHHLLNSGHLSSRGHTVSIPATIPFFPRPPPAAVYEWLSLTFHQRKGKGVFGLIQLLCVFV